MKLESKVIILFLFPNTKIYDYNMLIGWKDIYYLLSPYWKQK